jgi:energy-coupling factor transporter ATP-binding protein EcfA2
MSKATNIFALSLDQVTKLILNGGDKRTVLVQGHMGTGKSSLLKTLAQELPSHTPCYFDCTTKDLGDITIPNLHTITDDAGTSEQCVKFVPNEELGVHLNKPIILMIDEYGKANPAVKNAMLRVILERKIGGYSLHPDSVVFATTNLGAEGVGDLLPPHARNRMTVVTSRKPTNMEWVEWGVNNGVDYTVLGWAKDNPQIFYSFEDVANPDENPYIYHPKAQRAAFCTPRSMEAASDWVKMRTEVDDQTLTAALIGTVGERAALDLVNYVKMVDQLPSLESIKKDPKNAKVPDSAAVRALVVFRTLTNIESDWVDAWMDYMERLDKEAQGMFGNGVRAEKYSKKSVVMSNKKFGKWAMENNYMFASDKK